MKEQNRIRQLAKTAREKMPKDYKSFCLVAAHLAKNAHRYYIGEFPNEVKSEVKMVESHVGEESNPVEPESICRDVNQKLRSVRTLKSQNRIKEQQESVNKIKEAYGSYRDLAKLSGMPLKTIHAWCAPPKERQHRGTAKAKLKQQEFCNFLMQDTITYSHPSKKYAGKKFLMHTWNDIFKKYQEQPEFHEHGFISRTTMRNYKPKFILLSGQTPANQCLCDICENCELIRKSLLASGIKSIPPNKYACVDSTLCTLRQGKFATSNRFPPINCVNRDCKNCGKCKLKVIIEDNNRDLLKTNKRISWHRWDTVQGRSVPQKLEIKGTLKAAVNEFLDIVEDISDHLFRANWHRSVFQYMKAHLLRGYVLQVMDFAMNFSNRYQDEVQSAYYGGSQTTIHATVNFHKCLTEGCGEVVTHALVHISADLKHDSFLSRAAMNLTFKYLADIGIPLDMIIQFCDNCAAQYKSRRPFVEISRCALQLIRIYFGEKHGKSHADGLFGRLKAWMLYKIKARHFVVTSAFDFYKFCREHYQMQEMKGCCQHYKVEFEFIRSCDIRRHQDSDLDEAVPGTHKIYSVRNTPNPLTLKVRHVPCLCPPCISEEGECLNKSHTDPWRLVELVPERGSNLRKYDKRKRPDWKHVQELQKKCEGKEHSMARANSDDGISYEAEGEAEGPEQSDCDSGDEDLQSIVFKDSGENKEMKEKEDRNVEMSKMEEEKSVTDTVTDTVTEDLEPDAHTDVVSEECLWVNSAEEITVEDFLTSGYSTGHEEINDEVEIIEICSRQSKEFEMSSRHEVNPKQVAGNEDLIKMLKFKIEIPEDVLWPSILSAFEGCNDFDQLRELVMEVNNNIPPLKPRTAAFFSPLTDHVDAVAQSDIPLDGPTHLNACATRGDGNCLCRALSKAFYNSDEHHIEIRVRLLIEGVINMQHYLSDDCLERGASFIHKNADLPTVFTTFSEFYTPGQKITKDTMTAVYCLELHSCARLGSYMGLWQ